MKTAQKIARELWDKNPCNFHEWVTIVQKGLDECNAEAISKLAMILNCFEPDDPNFKDVSEILSLLSGEIGE